ncbi:MAG TPA: hypothetical protein DET40_01955 [Lentisphaeria bacterium]|nr:MAG: hypothetical protein A2X45_10980 [Lentisphaerae bacterium GWF2_50_93]HCE42296.1 hypothetical protein [Lentisphaeria bacterium]
MPKLRLEIGASISGLKSALGQAKGMISGFAGTLGAGLGAAGLALFAKSAIDAADAVADGSAKLAISAESYQKLKYAAEQSGSSMESVQTAFKKMSSVISDAFAGNETAIGTLNKLGVSLQDLQGKSPDEQFAVMADALNDVSNATDKAAYAQDIFGKSGADLNIMIRDYKALGQELEDMGGIMSNEAVEAANKFNDAINQLKTSLTTGLVNSGLVQWLADVAEGMNAVVSMGNKLGGDKGITAPGNAGYRGGVAGFFANMKDGIFGEAEGTQLITNDTAADKAKLAANKKKFEETGKTTTERKEEKAEKAELLKKQDAINKALEEYDKEQKKLLAEGLKEQEQIEGSINALNQKIAIQKLINEGKEKEAAIQEAINEASSKGALSDEQRASITQSAGELFDLSKKADVTKAIDMTPAQISDSVSRIGGSIGGASAVNYMKDQLTTQKQIYEALNNIKSGMMNPDKGLAIWP